MNNIHKYNIQETGTTCTSSQKLIPTPGFLPPGYLSVSFVFLCFLPPGEILKSGVGITCWVPNVCITYHYLQINDAALILVYLILLPSI